MPAVHVKIKDRGFRELQGKLKLFNTMDLTVGVQGQTGRQKYSSGVSVVDVATWNEFGTETIPERSFLRSTFRERRDDIQRVIAQHMAKMLKVTGPQPLDTLANIGREIVKMVRMKIETSRQWAIPLSTATIGKKRRSLNPTIRTNADYPLHATNRLQLRSVTWEIRSKRVGNVLAIGAL